MSTVKKDIPQNANKELDILFVIDDSPSMQPVQGNLVCNFPAFMDVLKNLEDGLPNIHLGVITTNNGIGAATRSYLGSETRCASPDGGRLVATPRVSTHPTCATARIRSGSYIEDVADPTSPNGRRRNYDGDISDVFGCIAEVGVTGCGFEAVLGSVEAALGADAPKENQGFLRKNAYLAVIFITNEDDCSVPANSLLFDPRLSESTYGPPQSFRCTQYGVVCQGRPLERASTPALASCTGADELATSDPRHSLMPVRHYIDFLSRLKPSGKLIMAAVAGPTTPFRLGVDVSDTTQPGTVGLEHSCSSSFVPTGSCGGAAATVYADPAVRLKQVVDSAGANGTFETLCQESYSSSMRVIAENISRALGGRCLGEPVASKSSGWTRPLDRNTLVRGGKVVDPETVSCTVEDIEDAGQPTQKVARTLSPCNPQGQNRGPCWALMADPTCEGDASRQYSVQICRNGFDPDRVERTRDGKMRPSPCVDGPNAAADGTTAVVSCATAPAH